MTNENKFFVLSVVVVLIVAGLISYKYLKPMEQTAGKPSTTGQELAVFYTLAEVNTHNSKSDCWQVIAGKVYDLTAAIDKHPGGAEAITKLCGQDGTEAFNTRNGNGPHPAKATEILQNFYKGDLK